MSANLCPSCGTTVASSDTFCEACGAALDGQVVGTPAPAPASAPTLPATSVGPDATSVMASPRAGSCHECGGDVLPDGFCGVCGQRARAPRDHWVEAPVPWLAGVCDKGIAHARNEDALALAGVADGSFAALVVCDGVTTAPDSDRASLAAAREACAVLAATSPAPGDGVAAVVSHWSRALQLACAEANAEVVGVARALGDPPEPPSCTFVAAVQATRVLTVAWCGDSRAYWVPDDGAAALLTLDHSLGTEMIRAGTSRLEAERDPAFHTITRWLGADSHDATPDVVSRVLDDAGWVVLCSDGLWNYASEPDALAERVRQCAAEQPNTPADVAARLVAWANDQGGHDNITVALSRVERSVQLPAEEG